jgi:hypothetical protein
VDRSSEYIIVAASIALIAVLIAAITYYVGSYVKENNVKTSDTTVYYECAPGLCPTNKKTGTKRCGSDPTESLLYDPLTEVCNSAHYCEHPDTPYALHGDGSTDIHGVCDPGVACRCVKKPQCPLHSLVIFESSNGNAYLGTAGTNYTIAQKPGTNAVQIGLAGTSYTDINTQFCQVNPTSLNRLSPGACNFILDTPSWSELRTCINSNPCVIGSLAYAYPGDAFLFKATKDSFMYPLVCAPSNSTACASTEWPVWDRAQNKIVCVADS